MAEPTVAPGVAPPCGLEEALAAARRRPALRLPCPVRSRPTSRSSAAATRGSGRRLRSASAIRPSASPSSRRARRLGAERAQRRLPRRLPGGLASSPALRAPTVRWSSRRCRPRIVQPFARSAEAHGEDSGSARRATCRVSAAPAQDATVDSVLRDGAGARREEQCVQPLSPPRGRRSAFARRVLRHARASSRHGAGPAGAAGPGSSGGPLSRTASPSTSAPVLDVRAGRPERARAGGRAGPR